MDNQNLWKVVMTELETSVSRANFQTWLRDTFIAEDAGETITIGVPNNFYLDWIRRNYHKSIAETLRRLRPAVREITYKVAAKTPAPPVELSFEPQTVAETPIKPTVTAPQYDEPVVLSGQSTVSTPLTNQPTNQSTNVGFQPSITNLDHIALTPPGQTPLDPNRTFDTFIVGNANRLAHAVSLAAAQEPGVKYNPLFLYGGVGLGKTHLAQAIGNEIRRQNPSAKITYVSCEAFTNDFIESLRKKDIDAFKKRYRHSDVLLIDDVQFMSGKEQTQEEFFHTFNALHQAKKQIVLTADREPKNIPAMEDRLTSRFAWGMVADIQPPDFETRVAILRARCIEQNYNINDEGIQMLAQMVQSNIRELEGALQQLVTRSQVENKTITADYVAHLYGGTVVGRGRSLNTQRIVQVVCEFFELKSDEVTGSRRYKELVYPRQLIMYLLRHELSYSYPKIGKELGGKDHTTIMHGVEKIEKELARNSNIQYDISKLKEKLYQG